jgi:hypothetical protein
MLRRRDWLMIQERLRQGVYVKDVAVEWGGFTVHGEPGAPARRCTGGTAAGGATQQTGRVQV